MPTIILKIEYPGQEDIVSLVKVEDLTQFVEYPESIDVYGGALLEAALRQVPAGGLKE